MSSDFSIVGGLVALPIMAAVASIAGAGYLVYKGAQAVQRHNEARKRREEEEKRVYERLRQQKNEAYYSQMMSIFESYRNITAEYEHSRQAVNDEMEKTLADLQVGFSSDLKSSADPRKFESILREKEEEALSVWREKNKALQEDFSRRMKEVSSVISHDLEKAREGLASLKDTNREDNRRKAFTESAIEQARASLELLRAEADEIPGVLSSEFQQAEAFFHSGDFDIAYSKASWVMVSCLDKMEDVRMKKAQYYSLLEQAEAKLQEILERLKESEKVQFSWEGSLLEEDLSRFEPYMFGGIKRRINDLAGELEHLKNFNASSIGSLSIIASELDEVNDDFMSICRYASAKMVFAYSENDNAEIITDILEEQGFVMTGSVYESDIEGNALNINFQHSITGENITVELNPDENGVTLSVHNYGREGETSGDVRTQKTVQDAIETKLGRKGTCINLGGVSSKRSASDLDALRASRVRESQAARRYLSNVLP